MTQPEGAAPKAAAWRRCDAPIFERAVVIGLGLIGSSFARAMRRSNVAKTIIGADASAETRAKAEALGFLDAVAPSAREAATDADFVILCAPVGAMAAIGAEIADALKPGAILSDVGSVKAAVVADLAPLLPEHVDFVPAHPIAGTEHSGPEAGFAELFENRWCLLTPLETARAEAAAKVEAVWRAIGSEVERMTPEHHDRVVAVVSHLPHLIAYTIVGTASDLEEVTRSEVMKFSAAGFRDFTRIAASDPTMWRDVFLTNREAVLELLGRFTEDLVRLQRAIRWGDGEVLFEHFTKTRAIRRGILELGQDTAAPDFGRRPQAGQTVKAAPSGDGAKDEPPE